MASRTEKISLDTVSPGEVTQLNAGAKLALDKVMDAMIEAKGLPDEATIGTAIDAIVKSFPGKLAEEMGEERIQILKQEWSTVINDFLRRFPDGKEPTQADLQGLVARLFMSLMGQHIHAVARNPVAMSALGAGDDSEQFENGYDATVKGKHPSIALQKLLGTAMWGVSFYASWKGATHYVGMFTEWAQRTFGFTVAPLASVLFRNTTSILASGWSSNVVQDFKERIEKHANDKNAKLTGATKDAIKEAWHKSKVFAILAAAVLVVDIGTNFNGAITVAAESAEVTDQINLIRADVGRRLNTIREEIVKAGRIPQDMGKQAQTIIDEEKAGKSATNADGEGPMYFAKNAAYKEDGAAADALRKAKFGKDLLAAIQTSGLKDGKPLQQEVEEIVGNKVTVIEQKLAQIEKTINGLSASAEIEYLNRDLKSVVKGIEEIISMLSKDLPDDLNQHLEKYNDLSSQLVQIAQQSGKYKKLQPNRLANLESPTLDIKNEALAVEDFHYVGFEDLAKVLKQQFNPSQQTILVLLACLIAFAASYLDLITLKWTRKAHQKDRREIEGHGEFMEYWLTKLSTVITAALNSGPFSEYFKGKEQLHPHHVRSALEARLARSNTIPRDSEFYRKVRKAEAWVPLPPIPGWSYPMVDMKQTEDAQRHNATAGDLMKLVRDPREFMEFLKEIMPGLKHVEEPSPSIHLDNVRARDGQHVDTEFVRFQAEEIRGVEQALKHLDMTIDDEVLQRVGGQLNYLRASLKTRNAEAFNQAQKHYETLLDKSQHGKIIQQINRLKLIETGSAVSMGVEAWENSLVDLVEHCSAQIAQLNDVIRENNKTPYVTLTELHSKVLAKHLTLFPGLLEVEVGKAQATPRAPEETLLESEKGLNKMATLVNEVEGLIENEAALTVLVGVKTAMERKRTDIATLRDDRARAAREQQNREAARQRTDKAAHKFEGLKDWSAERNTAQSDFARANIMCGLLGERELLAGLRARNCTTMDTRTAERLKSAMERINDELDYLEAEDVSRREAIAGLRAALNTDWELVKTWVPAQGA